MGDLNTLKFYDTVLLQCNIYYIFLINDLSCCSKVKKTTEKTRKKYTMVLKKDK